MRLALRSLAKQPLFTAAAVATIAIAIGANTAIFSVANWALLRGVPGVSHQSELMTVQLQSRFGGGLTISHGPTYRAYTQYRAAAERVTGVAGVRGIEVNFAAQTSTVPERVSAEIVTDNYFSVLGVPAARGRLLGAADTIPGAAPAVVVSERLWHRLLATAPGPVGTVTTINDHAFTIVGVAGAGFEGTQSSGSVDRWVPIRDQSLIDQSTPALHDDEGPAFEMLIARARPGVTPAAVRAEAEARLPHAGRYLSTVVEAPTIQVQAGIGAPAEVRAQVRRMVVVLFAGVGLVLLIACANVANLLLARGAARRREVALRRSLGASSWRLARQLLGEGLLLGLAGGGVGVIIALWGTSLLRGIKLGPVLPELPLVSLDARVLAFAAAISIVTAILFSLPPLIGTLRADPATMLRNGGHGATGRTALQGTLVVAQVAVSFVLVVGAALFTRTVHNLRATDLGFRPEGIATFSIDLRAQGYNPQSGGALVDRLVERLRSRSGITSVATAGTMPFNGMIVQNVRPETQPADPSGAPAEFTPLDNVTPSYFATLGISLLAGRGFTEADMPATDTARARVAIVSETMAKRFWPGRDAVGQLLHVIGSDKAPPISVIGVVADVKVLSPVESASLFYYMPASRAATSVNVLVRSTLPTSTVLSTVREELAALDPNLPIYDVYTIRERADRTFAQQLTAARLMTAFGVIGLLLAVVGLYAVIAFTVAQRTRELAIRIALGAGDVRLRAAVVRDALRLTLVGVATGGIAAWQLARLVAGALYGVGGTDPASYVLVTAAMLVCAVAASYLPARRATRVDPMIVMRAE